MPDLKNEPMAIKAMNDLLDWLSRYPDVRGAIYGITRDGLRVTIKVENEKIAHADP